MVSTEDIRSITRLIVEKFEPMAVILFGSQADQTARRDSDIDLLVVLDFDGAAFEKAAEIRASLPSTFALDIIARTPAVAARGSRFADPITCEALRTGTTTYARAA